jgi:hypothetical protein
MNVVETILVFAGIPLGLAALLAIAVYGKALVNQNRYRPGRPWTHDPVWYLPHPVGARGYGPTTAVAALPAAAVAAAEPERMGGASGEW